MSDPQGSTPNVNAPNNGSPEQPVLSKKKAKKALKVTQKIKMVPGSVDVMVQHTNDDSVVSKRSAVANGYVEDNFLRHFVRKPSRRSPLINRGYYLRMAVITDVVTRSLRYLQAAQDGSSVPVQVISLGAGFDTMAFRSLLLASSEGKGDLSSTQSAAQFFDVDFPRVMQNKASLMKAAPPGSFPEDWVITPENEELPVCSPRYRAVGVDLRDAQRLLLPRLSSSCAAFSPSNPTVIYAECVMQYMPHEAASALIRFLASTFSNAIFIAYDQMQPSDSFGKLMQQSLKQKSSPLLGIELAPDGFAMTSRALREGMKHAWFANFYDLSRFYIQGEERCRVEGLELFDELEEWAEMCEHYGITLAVSNDASKTCVADHPAFKCMKDPSDLATSGAGTAPVRSHPWPTGRFSFEGWGNGQVYAETADAQRDDTVLVSFGGFSALKGHQRVNQVYAYALQEGELSSVVSSDCGEPPSLVFHSFTRVAPFEYIVFGGRTNPNDPSNRAYLLSSASSSSSRQGELSGRISWTWGALTSISETQPQPRYRHMAVFVGSNQIFLYGGRSASGEPLQDAWMATVDTRQKTIAWAPVKLVSDEASNIPPPLHSAAMLHLDGARVVLSGGMHADDRCSDAIFTIDVDAGTCTRATTTLPGARFSHSMTKVRLTGGEEYIFVLGGSTCDMKVNAHRAALIPAKQLDTTTPLELPATCPSWSKHSCVALGQGVVAVVGGGYTCFSFGTYTSKPMILSIGDDIEPIRALGGQSPAANYLSPTSDNNNNTSSTTAQLLSRPWQAVMELPYSPESFMSAVTSASAPVVFRNVNLGDCTVRWSSAEYLKQAEGKTPVSIHVAQKASMLDFVRKNFTFRHVPFEELVDHIQSTARFYKTHRTQPEETWYYRSIATHMKSDRADIWRDFQVLGNDFKLPSGAAEHITPRIHQSCLRMNAAPLQLWTHYDTLDNVLCQIVGEKRVVLFPPSEYVNLYMSGSSSPVLNIDAPDLHKYPRFIDACKRAQEVVLRPGDMLYFPANWFHHITTLVDEEKDSFSVSANVFFRRFDSDDYDKKDLYGNKDVPAVCDLRRGIVEHALSLVRDQRLTGTHGPLPTEYAEFALREAIQDLEKHAETLAEQRALNACALQK